MRARLLSLVFVLLLTMCSFPCSAANTPSQVFASMPICSEKSEYTLCFKLPSSKEFIFYMPAGNVYALGLNEQGFSKNPPRIKIVTTIFSGEKAIATCTVDTRDGADHLSAIYSFPPDAKGGFWWGNIASISSPAWTNSKIWKYPAGYSTEGVFQTNVEYRAVVRIEGNRDRDLFFKIFGLHEIQIARRFFQ